jgi:tetratricopeptide (TPR) repeat protein
MGIFRNWIMKKYKLILLILAVFAVTSGCVYYNTFYYARKAFNDAESQRKKFASKMSAKSFGASYNKAIEKSQKVLEKYPNSKWYDDALYVNGVSHFYMENYSRAEKRFRELIANFPKSGYVKETRLYLAKAKLKLGDVDEAMVLFESLFQEVKDKSIREEAALAIGEHFLEKKEYEEANKYFQALIDSLGSGTIKKTAQLYIADGHFARFNYKSAFDNYLKVLDMDPDLDEKYQANFRAGECCFYLHQIEDGMGYFERLTTDRFYYDSLYSVYLMMGWGNELDGNISAAELIYRKVSDESKGWQAAMANYNMGLIYQFDYENYKKAKEYYDLAKKAGSRTDIYEDALQRSSDIGKLMEFSKLKTLDTTSTQKDIDDAANTQFLLAELYLIQLGKPDSAYKEYEYIVNNIKDSYIAPKAYIAMALLKRDQYDDTLGFDSTLRIVLTNYPKSDFVPEAISLLGLSGTKADTGYAAYYYSKAENYLFDQNNPDSARYYYQLIADSFPRSDLNVKAHYAVLWLTENYISPGDSSLYYAFTSFVDSFPGTIYTSAASKEIAVRQRKKNTAESDSDTTQFAATDPKSPGDTTTQKVLTKEERYSIDPDGNTIYDINQVPKKVDKDFRYPTAAYTLNFEGNLYFQIKIDPFGDVADLRLMSPTPSEELNQEAIETVQLSHFNTQTIPTDLLGGWFIYKFMVKLPQSLR